jgi:hypothetical protein
MKRLGLLAAALLATCAFSGVAASSSMALCLQVDEPGTGDFTNSECTTKGVGEWVWVKQEVTYLGNNVWCAETTFAGEGNYTDGTCQKKVANSNFELVIQPTYPSWKIQGKRIGPQEKRQMKIIAGPTTLRGTIVSESSKISCQKAVVENAYIEGNGTTGAGQDGSTGITFTECTNVGPANCTITEPIKTTQLKSHLVTYGEGQGKVGDLFEPSQGTEFASIRFHGALCPKGIVEPASFPVKGSVAAELKPKTQKQEQEPLEAVIGEIAFPEQSISKVKLEGQTVEPKLSIGANPSAVFVGKFEAQLVSQSGVGIPFGISR